MQMLFPVVLGLSVVGLLVWLLANIQIAPEQ